MGKLIQVGFRLAVLGVDPMDMGGPWHVMKPGAFNVPILSENKTVGRALCGRNVITNGYAADFEPEPGQLCPGCREQL